MNLNDSERLIVFMLAEIMEAMKLDDEIDPTLIKSLAASSDDWAIKHKYSGLFPSESRSDDVVRETIDLLWMWGIVEHGITNLQGTEATQAKKWHSTSFTGFDGNNDEHYGVAVTLIEKLDEFGDFKGRGLNSHTQSTLPRYRQMYAKFDQDVSAGNASPLGFDALKDICN